MNPKNRAERIIALEAIENEAKKLADMYVILSLAHAKSW